MRIVTFYLVTGSALCVTPALAQTAGNTDFVHLAVAEELSLARSAGPAEVSDEATLWLLENGAYVVAQEGTNGNHCFVMRSMPQSLEPICYDEEGAKTVMQWEFKFFELRMAGLSPKEVDQALADALESGSLPLPARPAMSYMLSSGQRLYNSETGRSVGNWKPHLMLYIPYLMMEDIGLSEGTPDVFVYRSGTPRAHIIMAAPKFEEPKT